MAAASQGLIARLRSRTLELQKQIVKFVDQQGQRSLQNAKQMETDVWNIHEKVAQAFNKVLKDAIDELDRNRRKQVDLIQAVQIKNQNELREFSQLKMDCLTNEIEAIEMELADQKQFLNKANVQDVVDLQVGSQPVTVGRDLLTSIKGSRLEVTFSGDHGLKLMSNNRVFLDRNPQIFDYCLQYLRSGRSFVPKSTAANPNIRELFDMEVRFWNLDRGLARIDSMANREQVDRIEAMLSQAPRLDAKKQMKCMEMWRRLGPLRLEDILQHSELKVDFDADQTEY